jgi:hypothetical protein
MSKNLCFCCRLEYRYNQGMGYAIFQNALARTACQLALWLSLGLAVNTATAQLATPWGGIGFGGGNLGVNLDFGLGQSSHRSISSSSASLTVTDGVPGFFSSTVIRPFVTGYVPIVSGYGYPDIPNPAAQIAHQDGQQRARVQQSQQRLKIKSLEKYLRRAERAESDGNKRMARANYLSAIRIADEPLRSELRARLSQLLSQ